MNPSRLSSLWQAVRRPWLILMLSFALAVPVVGVGTWASTRGDDEQLCEQSTCTPRYFVLPVPAPTPVNEAVEPATQPAPVGTPRFRMVGPVDARMFGSVAMFLDANAGAKRVVLELDTPGGSVVAGHQIIKAIEESRRAGTQVVCVADGWAVSMGFAILQSCSERVMTKRGVLMAHSPLMPNAGLDLGPSTRNAMESLRVVARAMAEQCAARMKVTLAEYIKRTSNGKEWWFNWVDAVKFGAVDRVVTSVDELL